MRLALSLALSAFLVVVGVATPGNAGETGDYTADGVNIRTGPHLTDTVVGLGYYGQGICAYFSVQGDQPPGWLWSTWTYHQNQSTSVTGYSFNGYLMFFGGTC